jgi:predicted DCC family thiol-disulfide oxidoreductase YuxK
MKPSAEAPKVVKIYYDGACPFCSDYVRLLRLRKEAGTVELIDARAEPSAVKQFADSGLDLDKGMIAEIDGTWYHGAEAVTALAEIDASASPFGWLHHRIFRHGRIAKALYPVMRWGRSFALTLLGRGRISGDANRQR